MRPWTMIARLLQFCAISLTACQRVPPQVQIVTLPLPPLPASLLLANKGPHRPPAPATQRTAALVIANFAEALAACNADKEALARIFEDYETSAAGGAGRGADLIPRGTGPSS